VSAVPDDPVLRRRERYRLLCTMGQRVGYSLFALAIVLFVVGFVADFPEWIATSIVVCLLVGSAVLAPAIVFSYAVKAADKEDLEGGT
jgi:ABC-type thiamin/hydroxymethylpyrimidine transport system permease subunit